MPKQKYIIRDFSGGMNSLRDPRDIAENEMAFIQNFSIDAIGKLKTAGGFYNHVESNDGSTDLTEYISNAETNIKDASTATINGAGYGAFYFESDHGLDNNETITLVKTGGGALVIGDSSNGQISFGQTATSPDPGATFNYEEQPR